MGKERVNYLSYLLRLWQEENHEAFPGAGKAIWRASLESAHTGEKRTFVNLDDLFVYLKRQIGAVSVPKNGTEEGDIPR